MDQLVNLLKEKTGLDDAMAEKVVGFIKDHMHEIPKMLGGDLGDKAKGLLGGAGGGLMDQAKGLLGGGDD